MILLLQYRQESGRDQFCDPPLFRFAQNACATQVALTFSIFTGQQMPRTRFRILQLTLRGHFDPLRCRFVCLFLRHIYPAFITI